MNRSASSSERALDPEDELDDLRKRFHLLESDRKAYYETSQWTIRQNKDTMNGFREENKQLREAVSNLQKGIATTTLKATNSIEIVKLEQSIVDARKKYDDLKAIADNKEEELFKHQDQLSEVNKESSLRQNESQAMQSIRSLENRLDKAMIKFNEAQSIKKTYEQILKRLHEEKLGFDKQLQTLEETIKAKDADIDELNLMARDANHAREVARTELMRFEQTIEDECCVREKELTEKRQLVKTKVELNERMEKRRAEQMEAQEREDERERQARRTTMLEEGRKEEEQAKKITTYEEAFRKIKDATGVSDVNDVIQKFLTQEETHNNLLALKQEAQSQIDALNEEKAQLKAKLEEIKYSGTGSLGSRRIVDEFETHLSESTAKYERAKQRYERGAKILINVKAGVEYLADKLQIIKGDTDIQPISSTITDESVVDTLAMCENSITRLMDNVNNPDVFDTSYDHRNLISTNNIAAASKNNNSSNNNNNNNNSNNNLMIGVSGGVDIVVGGGGSNMGSPHNSNNIGSGRGLETTSIANGGGGNNHNIRIKFSSLRDANDDVDDDENSRSDSDGGDGEYVESEVVTRQMIKRNAIGISSNKRGRHGHMKKKKQQSQGSINITVTGLDHGGSPLNSSLKELHSQLQSSQGNLTPRTQTANTNMTPRGSISSRGAIQIPPSFGKKAADYD